MNFLLEAFLEADKIKLISCNKETLSKLTGLSERMIDERRRRGELPHFQISNNNGVGGKVILYNPLEIKKYIEKGKK